jgi:hypothetical protein
MKHCLEAEEVLSTDHGFVAGSAYASTLNMEAMPSPNSVTSIGLHCVTSQKTVLFMTTVQTNASQAFYFFVFRQS